MPSRITNDGNTLDAQAQTPAINSWQIDASGLGGITESINLFRGDITVPLSLVSITNRAGLEASATIVYHSSLKDEVDTWNLEAPTGPLGLGWSMGYDFIAIDNKATLTPNDDNFFLISDGSSNPLNKISITNEYWEFEAESYRFWRIRYYLADEKWIITKEDGNSYVFGGAVTDVTQSPVQYGVKWGGTFGNWIGSSIQSIGQTPHAIAWNLAEIRNPWGDSIFFQYENDVAYIGKSAGLPYTRSSRLKKVVAPYSRTLSFFYKPKRFDDEVREYQIPHIDLSSPDLHAYQDRYDTTYLDSIEARNSSDAPSGADALLVTIHFEYDLVNMSLKFQGNADFYKRYLRKINMTTDDGLDLPDFIISYFNDTETDLEESVNRGAIKGILYPQGGRVEYAYEETTLAGTNRSVDISTSGTPRVWFGPDYTVIARYDAGQRGLTVEIYSWNGLWVQAPQSYNFPEFIDLTTLNVSAEEDFFALSFITSGSNPKLYFALFHKQNGRYGQWQGEEKFTVLDISNGKQGLVTTGREFAIACASGGTIVAKVWNDRSKTWLDRSNSVSILRNAQYALAGMNSYFAIANFEKNIHRTTIGIYYLDKTDRDFHQANLQVSTFLDVDWQEDSTPQTFWSLGLDFASITYITKSDASKIYYTVKIQQWNSKFDALITLDKSYSVPNDTKLPYAQSVASGSVVGNLGNLFRYDGVGWQAGTLPVPSSDAKSPRFVYGADAAIVSGSSGASLALFDPFKLLWNLARQVPTTAQGIVPTASANYMSMDRQVFYRDNEGILNNIFNLDPNLKPDSLVNRAPYFIAYEDGSGNTHVLPLANGLVDQGGEIVLPNQKIYVDLENQPGTSLVGASSVLTYEGTDFNRPTRLTLYQFVNRNIQGEIKSYPVAGLSIDDGYPSLWDPVAGSAKSTRYYYDCDHVTVTPDGSVTEYAAATAVYGVPLDEGPVCYPAPDKTKFGRSEYRYHNNRSPRASGLVRSDRELDSAAYYYSYLSGMLFDKTDYTADGDPVEYLINLYDVRIEFESVDAPGVRIPLIGGYVKLIEVETSQYEKVIDVTGSTGVLLSNNQIPPELVDAYKSRGIDIANSEPVAARTGGRWRLFLSRNRQTFLPVAMDGNRLTGSVAVTRSVKYEFSWSTGLLFSDSTDNYNSQGKMEENLRQIYYCWQVQEPANEIYRLMKDRHIWSPVALSIKFSKEDGQPSPGVPVEFALTTIKKWFESSDPSITKGAPCRTYSALTAGVYDPSKIVPVRFSDWNNNNPSQEGWRQMGEVTVRTESGGVLEALDVERHPSSTLTSKKQVQKVAEFSNASLEEATYLGFEGYETTEGWLITGGSSIESCILSGDAHTGYQCLLMKPDNAAALRKSLVLKNHGTTYILSCWIKTPAGFNNDGGAATWRVESSGVTLLSFTVQGTAGGWEYRNYVVKLDQAQQGEISASIVLRNQKASAASVLLVDDIMFAPLVGTAAANVYSPLYGDLIQATVALNGATARNVHDSYKRVMANVNVGGAVTSAVSFYEVRQIHREEPFHFPQDKPNSLVSVNAFNGGTLANFVEGASWKDQWASVNMNQWSVQDGRLVHSAAGSDSIEFVATRNLNDYGVRVSVHQPVDSAGRAIPPANPLGLSIGSDLSATWTPNQGWAIRLGLKTTAIPLTTSGSAFNTEWFLLAGQDPVTGNTSVYFYADGQQLFAELDTEDISGAVSLFVTDKGISFSGIATLQRPQLSITYVDGSGKERQKQAFDGSGTIVSGSLYDPIGRAAVGVKATRIPDAPLGYQPDYVTTFDPVTGIMTGLAADAYPEDEGYPYARTEFFRNAMSVAYKQGVPGKDFAVVQSGSFGSEENENQHVVTYAYGTNVEGQFGGDQWPSNQYFVTKVTNPNGNVGYSLTTKTGKTIAKMQAMGDGSYQIFQYYYNSAERLIRTLPPNAFKNAGNTGSDAWATISEYNFAGDLISQKAPDSGTIQYVYDLAGRLRFAMNAQGADSHDPQNTILYSKYDALGRVTEEGLFKAIWNRAELEQKAISDPNWPDATQSHSIAKINRYDGEGTDPTFYGQLQSSDSYTFGSSKAVVEIFTYDILGNVISKTMVAEEFDPVPRRIAYAYNALNLVVQIDYPDGSDIRQVAYSYNLLAQMFRIGIPGGDPAAFGTFNYNAVGALVHSTLNLGVAGTLQRQATYNPPGWPLTIEDKLDDDSTVLGQILTYQNGGYQDAGYYDGKVASVRTTGNGDDYSYKFRYDELSQLTVAENTVDANASLGVGNPVQYDPNGNITSLTRGNVSDSYHYEEETDQVKTITTQQTEVDAYSYNLNGAVTSGKRLDLTRLTYDPVSGRTTEIDLGSNPPSGFANDHVQFRYDGEINRAIKIVKNGADTELLAKLYVRDGQSLSLFERTRKAQSNEDAQFIYGPDGLMALHTNSKRYTVVRDYLGSVRRVVDETGSVVASYNYTPFGVIIDRSPTGQPDIVLYRYTSREYDPETCLYNYTARFYDPVLGRFYSVDPAGLGGSPYVYVNNNPTNTVDPNGEEPLTAFLIAVLVTAIIGAIAGAVTYALTYKGNFNVGKLFAYAAVGFVAGAIGGAVGYGVGLLATAGLAAIGVSTSTNIASGIIVGAATGAADGVVSSTLNQLGVNLVEGEDPGKGLGTAAWMGAAIGAGVGAALGGITGAANYRTASRLQNPDSIVTSTNNGGLYAGNRGAAGRQFGWNNIGGANNQVAAGEVLAFAGHSDPGANVLGLPEIQFTDAIVAGSTRDINTILADMGNNFAGRGIDLTAVCFAGRNGLARQFANNLNVPVRASTVETATYLVGGLTVARMFSRTGHPIRRFLSVAFRAGTYRTYYPSQLKTGWVALFGY